MQLDITEHCATGRRTLLLLNAAVLFRRPGHYMTVVRGHGQQQGIWLCYNDSLSYWMPDTSVEGIMREGQLPHAVQYVQAAPDMSRSENAGTLTVWGPVALFNLYSAIHGYGGPRLGQVSTRSKQVSFDGVGFEGSFMHPPPAFLLLQHQVHGWPCCVRPAAPQGCRLARMVWQGGCVLGGRCSGHHVLPVMSLQLYGNVKGLPPACLPLLLGLHSQDKASTVCEPLWGKPLAHAAA